MGPDRRPQLTKRTSLMTGEATFDEARDRIEQGRGQAAKKSRDLLMNVAGVASERLVATVSRQRDRHMTAGHLREQVRRKRRWICKWFAVERHQLRQEIRRLWSQDLLVVLGLVQLRDLARVDDLGVVLLLEPD